MFKIFQKLREKARTPDVVKTDEALTDVAITETSVEPTVEAEIASNVEPMPSDEQFKTDSVLDVTPAEPTFVASQEPSFATAPALEDVGVDSPVLASSAVIPAAKVSRLKALDVAVKRFISSKVLRKTHTEGDDPDDVARDDAALPLQVIVGYFPGVTEKDALEYAQGIAAKHFTQPSLVHYGAMKFDSGYLYEVHEGGEGRAYAPALVKQFNDTTSFNQEVAQVAVIQTATRLVEIQRKRDGVSAVLLPESAKRDSSLYIKPTKKLRSAVNNMESFHAAASWVLKSGLVVLFLSGLVFRVTPFDTASSVKVESISASQLPRTQWNTLVNTPPGYYVKTLRYAGGKWVSPELAPAEQVLEPVNVPGDTAVPAKDKE